MNLDLLHFLRDFALCMFILPAIGVALPGAIFFLLAKGTRILKRKMLPYVHLTQFYSRRVAFYTERASQVVAKPVIVTGGLVARIQNYAGQAGAWLGREES